MTTPNGYKMTTTFWEDFSIADASGIDAVQETYDTAFNEWKHDHVYLTELAIVLNWKIWQHYEKRDRHNENDKEFLLAKRYNTLWMETDEYAMDNLKDEELQFYIKVTD
jgi:hypothetical protein